MKIIYLLSVLFYLPDGGFKDGNQVDGWSPRSYATLEDCEQRKAFIENSPMPEFSVNWTWSCNPAPENWGKK